jgi:hypothetical protein
MPDSSGLTVGHELNDLEDPKTPEALRQRRVDLIRQREVDLMKERGVDLRTFDLI